MSKRRTDDGHSFTRQHLGVVVTVVLSIGGGLIWFYAGTMAGLASINTRLVGIERNQQRMVLKLENVGAMKARIHALERVVYQRQRDERQKHTVGGG